MSDLELTYAGLNYADRIAPLIDGSVRPQGIDLRYLYVPVGDLFVRVSQFAEFDVAEMSMSTFTNLMSRGDDRFVAIPAFPSRSFRHGRMFVRSDSGINEPSDLVGRKIGVPEYQMTAGVWQRAALQHDFGVEPKDIRWFEGGVMKPGYFPRNPIPPPPGVSIEIIPQDKFLEGMAVDGELDGLFFAQLPSVFADGSGRMRRLFPEWVEIEKDYYRRTGFFPIMHATVIRRDVYERNRWVAVSLMEALKEAQRVGWQRVFKTNALHVMLPWLQQELDVIDELMGANHWPYGFAENYDIVNAFCQYHFEQGLSERLMTPEELFVPETHHAPVGL